MSRQAEIIREARNLLFERGWTQLTLESADGSLCLVGAIRTARWGNELDSLCRAPSRRSMPPGLRLLLSEALGVPCRDIEQWNDESGRTFGEVIDALDKAEKIAESALAPPADKHETENLKISAREAE